LNLHIFYAVLIAVPAFFWGLAYVKLSAVLAAGFVKEKNTGFGPFVIINLSLALGTAILAGGTYGVLELVR